MISVIGLGQLYESLPLRAAGALQQAGHIILQTGEGQCCHEIARLYSDKTSTLDELYKNAPDFDMLYASGVERILESENTAGSVCFCCMDRPEENGFVKALLNAGVPFVVSGETDPAAEAVYLAGGVVSIGDYTTMDARNLNNYPVVDTSYSVVVTGVDNEFTASQVKIALSEFYPDEHELVMVRDGQVHSLTVSGIDREKSWRPSGVLVIPAVPFEMKRRYTYADALRVMELLRSPDGCPWDRSQTHDSLRPYLVEEAYEASDAAGSGDMNSLTDELGDVLLQVIFHAQIGREAGDFTDIDVATALCQKMIRRHPHVFGEVTADTPDAVITNWEIIKQQEREEKPQSVLDGVPDSMDPLMRALKIQQKAASVGFDWPTANGAADKVDEELRELHNELHSGTAYTRTAEGGDLLFAVVNFLRKLGVDPQSALQDACRKFMSRFHYLELHASAPLQEMTLEEMDELWDKAKAEERSALR